MTVVTTMTPTHITDLGACAKLQKETISFVTSVRMKQPRLTAKDIFIKFDIWEFFENLSTKFKFD
jgi:hypothetical protein